MSSIKFFVDLIKLMDDSASALGLTELTDTDRQTLVVLWDSCEAGEWTTEINYKSFKAKLASKFNRTISRAQFYKSIKVLENCGTIRRIGSERSQTYELLRS